MPQLRLSLLDATLSNLGDAIFAIERAMASDPDWDYEPVRRTLINRFLDLTTMRNMVFDQELRELQAEK